MAHTVARAIAAVEERATEAPDEPFGTTTVADLYEALCECKVFGRAATPLLDDHGGAAAVLDRLGWYDEWGDGLSVPDTLLVFERLLFDLLDDPDALVRAAVAHTGLGPGTLCTDFVATFFPPGAAVSTLTHAVSDVLRGLCFYPGPVDDKLEVLASLADWRAGCLVAAIAAAGHPQAENPDFAAVYATIYSTIATASVAHIAISPPPGPIWEPGTRRPRPPPSSTASAPGSSGRSASKSP